MTSLTPWATAPAPAEVPEGMQMLLSAYVRLQRASDAAADRLARLCDVPEVDLRGLVYVAGSQGLTPKDLGRELGLTSGSVTGLVDRMQQSGWAQRVPHPDDRRSTIIEVTAAGLQLVAEIGAVWAGAFAGVVAPADAPLISRALESMGKALSDLDVNAVASGSSTLGAVKG